MIKNYLLTAWRNILRNKLYTAVNIFCLSVGITGGILITMLADNEFSYDRHHINHKNIFRLNGIYDIGGSTDILAITPVPLGPALHMEFAQIKNYVRFQSPGTINVFTDDAEFIEELFFYTDSTVFDIFTHRFVSGQPQGALSRTNTAVLTVTTATRYFQELSPIGQIIRIGDQQFEITAIIEDVPETSHLSLDGLLSYSTLPFAFTIESGYFWRIPVNYTYIEMYDGIRPEDVFTNFSAFQEKYLIPMGRLISANAAFTATPLAQLRFDRTTYSPSSISKTSIIILIMVAVFLIVIVGVNYTNLATARATLRTRETGVRKVLGATSYQVVYQFITEAMMMAFFSMLLSLLLVEILLPGFNNLSEKSFSIIQIFQWKIIGTILLITCLTGLLAGAWPAIFLSRMQPAVILRASQFRSGGPAPLRKGLVILQFVVSIMLVTATLTARMQIDFLHNKDLGVNTDNKMVVFLSNGFSKERFALIEDQLLQHPGILATTKSVSVPGGGFSTIAVLYETQNGFTEGKIAANLVDPGYLDFFEIKLVEGRNFDKHMPTDFGGTALISQSAASYLGWHDQAIGKTIQWQFNIEGQTQRSHKVIGIFQDHHFLTLESSIEPLMLILPDEDQNYQNITIQYLPGQEKEIMQYIETTIHEFESSYLRSIYFLDTFYQESFSYQERLSNIFAVFAIVCIFISLIGLFGLSSFMAEQRKREVGIRKALGASTITILSLFYSIRNSEPSYWWLSLSRHPFRGICSTTGSTALCIVST